MNNSSFSQSNAAHNDWLILGAGSLGLLWAAALMQNNKRCGFILDQQRQKHYSGEFSFTCIEGRKQRWPAPAFLPEQCYQAKQILVACKAHDTLAALAPFKGKLSKDCRLLLAQNGLGIQQQVKQQFPDNPIFCAVITHGAWRDKNYSVIHAGQGICKIGAFNNLSTMAKHQLEQLPLESFNIELIKNIEQQLWQKLLVNAVINPLTVKYSCKNGELQQHLDECFALLDEHLEIARACGQTFNKAEQQQKLLDVIHSTAENRSSMLSDVSNNKPTEINYINGYLQQQALKQGIEAPLNDALVKLIAGQGFAAG